MSKKISCCIISFNERDNIGDCLDSVAFCDEIVVVDCGSNDGTIEIAEKKGAKIIINKPFPGHVEQKNIAVENASYDWILAVDCDERISKDLAKEIEEERKKSFKGVSGYTLKRVNWYLGKEIRFGALRPSRRLRLFDKNRGRWEGINPHDHVKVEGLVKKLNNPMIHFPYKDIKHHIKTIEKYTTIVAEASIKKGRRAYVWDPLIRPILFFGTTFFLRLGFLEGWRGVILSYLGSKYTHLKWKKILNLQKEGK